MNARASSSESRIDTSIFTLFISNLGGFRVWIDGEKSAKKMISWLRRSSNRWIVSNEKFFRFLRIIFIKNSLFVQVKSQLTANNIDFPSEKYVHEPVNLNMCESDIRRFGYISHPIAIRSIPIVLLSTNIHRIAYSLEIENDCQKSFIAVLQFSEWINHEFALSCVLKKIFKRNFYSLQSISLRIEVNFSPVMTLLLYLLVHSCCIPSESTSSWSEYAFLYRTLSICRDGIVQQNLTDGDGSSKLAPNLTDCQRIPVYIFGFNTKLDSDTTEAIIDAYTSNDSYCLIVLDWGKAAGNGLSDFEKAMRNVVTVIYCEIFFLFRST